MGQGRLLGASAVPGGARLATGVRLSDDAASTRQGIVHVRITVHIFQVANSVVDLDEAPLTLVITGGDLFTGYIQGIFHE
jgi:hypothetical protein